LTALQPIKKLLIANRGEIALRILRACKEMGIRTVAVHSTTDSNAMHVRLADESVCIGPPAARESYLNAAAILSAAEITGAEAIHPGYGFLAENADFAQMVVEHGFIFVGPDPAHIRMMGDKVTAKAAVAAAGIPTVPGSEGAITDDATALQIAGEIGYPVLIKAAAGGGGRGMSVVHARGELLAALRNTRNEARAGFGDERVYLEKYLDHPRHIELQVMADRHGNVVHLGERDCSLQRRHQKIVEESPSPVISEAERQAIGRTVVAALEKLGYLGAGTIEFLYQDGQFYFIEMNTRIQVEHPVTEMVTGIDLVREQIRVAMGHPLSVTQDQVRIQGHSIECRINAEDPETLIPQPGRITAYHPPGGPGVRVDSAIYRGYTVPPHYDSLIAKLIVHDQDRVRCIARLERSLAEFVIDGIPSSIPLLRAILAEPDFRESRFDTGWLERYLAARSGG
jgi:acetyl-CoA carboxylase, biotin carboxylase subunit